jgi:hypothetical protein
MADAVEPGALAVTRRADAPASDPPGACCSSTCGLPLDDPGRGTPRASGGLASLAQPMAAKLAVDTLGQHRSLAGPVALLAGSDHRRGPAQHGPPGIRRCGTAGRPHEAIGAVSSQAAARHPPGSASPGNTVDR